MSKPATKSNPTPKSDQQQQKLDAKKPAETRHSQTGQQQGQHGGATRGPGKGAKQ